MTTQRETAKALDAFEQYYALGPTRSLAKLAANGGPNLAQAKEWSAAHDWQERVLARQNEEIAASRAAAKKEAAILARRRLRNAQLMQEAAVAIIAKANITALGEDAARDLMGQARGLLADGMKAERDELAVPNSDQLATEADIDTLKQRIVQRLLTNLDSSTSRDLMAMLKFFQDAAPAGAQPLAITTIEAVLPYADPDEAAAGDE